MGKMDTTASINAQFPTSDIIPLIVKLTRSVRSLTDDCIKGENNKILLRKCFNEHMKLFKTVIFNSNYKFSLYIISFTYLSANNIEKLTQAQYFSIKSYWTYSIM